MIGAQLSRLLLVPVRKVADLNEAKKTDYALTVAQAVLAFGCLLAVYIDPLTVTPYPLLARDSLLLYTLFSVLMVVVFRLESGPKRWTRPVLHVSGVFWAAIAFLFTKSGGGPIFVIFLLFILSAAAFRWGFAQTVFTAGSCAALLLLAGNTMAAGPHRFSAVNMPGPFQWTTALLVLGCVVGYLVENDRKLRSETLATSLLISRVPAVAGMPETLQTILRATLDLFSASRIVVALQCKARPQSFLWDSEKQGSGQNVPVQIRELTPPDQDAYCFSFPGENWCATTRRRSGTRNRFHLMALSNQDERLHRVSCFLPFSFLSRHGFRSLLAVSFNYKEWSGRVFIFDPRRRLQPEADLRLLRQLVREVAPFVYRRHVLGRLRAHIREVERTRVAQELHDGVIQSLIALEMEVEELSRRVDVEGVAEELRLIQNGLKSEIQDFRDLMEGIKPIELGTNQPASRLGEIVDKFRITTGISASFVCESKQIIIPTRVGHQLVRILQEALVNVRKHSGAHKVLVRCAPVDGHLKVTVEDDWPWFRFLGPPFFRRIGGDGQGACDY